MMKDKVAIITGASRGIGKAICLDLAKQGVNVVVNYAGNDILAKETMDECISLGVKAIKIKADVSKFGDCEMIIEKTLEEFGKIDILINNAGITKDNLLIRMTEEEFDSVININLKGTFNMTKLATKVMMKQRKGRVLNISSIVGVMGNVGQANYAASKAGVIGFTKSVAREFAPRGITANVIAPGFVETDMTSNLSDVVIEKAKSTIPLGRFGKTEDIVSAVRFLVSDDAGYITGQVLCVDGGMAM
ncbi:MAG: 3-oxoacyl-[acyl-carrier-protein] reductase [Oscillospiraceae bacterium]